MEFPSYILDAVPVTGSQVLVIRSNKQNLKPDILELWDVATGERLQEIQTASKFTRVLAASTDAGIVVLGNQEGRLIICSLADGKPQKTLNIRGKREFAAITSLALIDHGRRALVGAGWGKYALGLWDLESGSRVTTYEGQSNEAWGIAVIDGEKRFLSASLDRSVRLWDIASGKCLHSYLEPGLPAFTPNLEAIDDQAATGVCVLRDGRRAVSSHGDGMLRCWDLKSGKLLHKARTAQNWARWLLSVAASPDEDIVAAGSWDNNVWLWQPGAEPTFMSGHIGEAGPLFFLDGRRVVSVSFDQTIRVWDVEHGKCERVIGKAKQSSRCPPNESMY